MLLFLTAFFLAVCVILLILFVSYKPVRIVRRTVFGLMLLSIALSTIANIAFIVIGGRIHIVSQYTIHHDAPQSLSTGFIISITALFVTWFVPAFVWIILPPSSCKDFDPSRRSWLGRWTEDTLGSSRLTGLTGNWRYT